MFYSWKLLPLKCVRQQGSGIYIREFLSWYHKNKTVPLFWVYFGLAKFPTKLAPYQN